MCSMESSVCQLLLPFFSMLNNVVYIYFKICDDAAVIKTCVSRHYPSSCFCLKHSLDFISKHDVSETGFCHVNTNQLGPIDRASPHLQKHVPTQIDSSVFCLYFVLVQVCGDSD
jgi:hypothetical protein